MAAKVTQPLFASTASGRLKSLGVYQHKRSSHYVALNITGNHTPVAATATLRYEFQIAHAVWMQKPRVTVISPTGKRRVRTPRWPDYWPSWLADQASKPFRTAHLMP